MSSLEFQLTVFQIGQLMVVRGYHGAAQDLPTLQREADRVGYPLLIKPTHGGGGKGMRVVRNSTDLEEEIISAKREAAKSFGNDEVLLERWLERPRHVEVQVFADQMGECVALWERDCSVQRRHQSGLFGPDLSLRRDVQEGCMLRGLRDYRRSTCTGNQYGIEAGFCPKSSSSSQSCRLVCLPSLQMADMC